MNPLFVEAESVISERGRSYGHASDSFAKVAKIWSVILGKDIGEKEVILCMIALKLTRELSTHKRDNLVDIAGYVSLYSDLLDQNS